MVCMTAFEYMACMLLSPCCRDDYFLYSVILPVHHIHCLDSFDQLCLTLILSSGCLKELVVTLVVPVLVGMNPEEGNLPRPPTMDQVLMEIERNRRDSHALPEVIARNSTQQRNE